MLYAPAKKQCLLADYRKISKVTNFSKTLHVCIKTLKVFTQLYYDAKFN